MFMLLSLGIVFIFVVMVILFIGLLSKNENGWGKKKIDN